MIHGPPELDHPGQLWNPSFTLFRFASRIAVSHSSNQAGVSGFAVTGRCAIAGRKTCAVPISISPIAFRSAASPSFVTQSPFQWNHACNRADSGGCANRSASGRSAVPHSAAPTIKYVMK